MTNSSTKEVRIYPNPVTNYTLNLEFLSVVREQVSITIFGTKGEKLYYNQVNPQGNKIIRIKLPDFFGVQTMYILNIQYNGVVVTERIFFE